MASFFDLTKPHLAYYSPSKVPAAFVLAVVPHTYSLIAAGKNFDIANPRNTVENCEKDTTLQKKTAQRIRRAEAATANAFETVGLYAGGIAAATAAGVPVETLNYLSVMYLASRAGYSAVYVWLQDNRKLAPLRSVCWNTSIGIIFALWIKAGNKASA
ncbi:hypothetical protein J7T55_014087 [Diaporthe amygdali]|uniref:uncharacterized protein n=1 Tax=Phomopsis amygdali TaxID=1214568 RepID=UPI0022FF27AD|nr:uncharacterized protein J7T55_014087 [Diaporthe amygdali]KAJ0109525.1 hypothetical protein J7T55_014087 [Diaporthe amygdali]